jgi:hypothetical protein
LSAEKAAARGTSRHVTPSQRPRACLTTLCCAKTLRVA